jgi:hypothetical protein
MKTKYYVRVAGADQDTLEDHLTRSGTEFTKINNDLANGMLTTLYAVSMEPQEVMALKLTVPLIGCLNFHKAHGKLHSSSSDKTVVN